MAISASQLKTELGEYSRTNNKEIKAGLYLKSATAKHMRTIASVKGRFPALQSITGHVVQGFKSIWNPLGLTKFRVNELKNYRQKVNFPIKPDDVQSSWIAHLYEENKKPQDMAISKYVIESELMPKIVADREILLNKAKYDANDLETFGKSMDGIVEMINKGLAPNSENPVYQIPMETVTVANLVDQVNEFELKLPEEIKAFVTKIFMSQSNLERYAFNYFQAYGHYPTYTAAGALKTIVGSRELVGLPGLNGSDLIFTTPNENFLRLIDINDEPAINDVQVADYDVKIFMEWWEGVAFWTNQLVVAGVIGGTVTGLPKAEDQALYFPSTVVVAGDNATAEIPGL